eukprot:5896180-Alexandrium_andersonii.AAC.1
MSRNHKVAGSPVVTTYRTSTRIAAHAQLVATSPTSWYALGSCSTRSRWKLGRQTRERTSSRK